MTGVEKCWLAGYLEGEGCFFTSPTGSPGIKFCTVDEDVAAKVGGIIGKPVRGPYSDRRGYQKRYEVNCYGLDAVAVMRLILPHMGKRRTERILAVLEDAGKRKLKGVSR